MSYDDALTRHKAIAAEAHEVAVQMRALVPERSGPVAAPKEDA